MRGRDPHETMKPWEDAQEQSAWRRDRDGRLYRKRPPLPPHHPGATFVLGLASGLAAGLLVPYALGWC